MNDRYDNPYILDCVMRLQAKRTQKTKEATRVDPDVEML